MRNSERLYRHPPLLTRIHSAIHATLLKTDHPTSISARISLAGLALLYPEITQDQWLAQITMLFIALGTTVDDIADEGLDADSTKESKFGAEPVTNALRYALFRAQLEKQLAPLHDSRWEKEIKQHFADVWKTEMYAHKHQLDEAQQLEYRELINAVWTVTYTSFVRKLFSEEIQEQSLSATEEDARFILPNLDDFQEVRVTVAEYQDLLEKYSFMINGDEGIDALEHILFLLVMETSNWYDTILNTKSNKKHTPRLRQYTLKYKKALEERGIPAWTTNLLFTVMSAVILSKRLMKEVGQLHYFSSNFTTTE